MACPDSVGVRRVIRDPLLSKGREVKKPRHEEMLFPMHSSTILSSALLLLSIATGCAGPGAAQDIATPAGAATSATLAQDVRAVQEALIEERITGSNTARVWRDGEVLYEGVANSGREGDAAITDETLFPIWSMSKPITIVAMLLLHEQGLFEWDDPVAKYIPAFGELRVKDGDGTRPAVEPLRIQHLMTHRSGYVYYALGTPALHEWPSAANQGRFADLAEFVEVAAAHPVEFEPGSQYAYGINQAILGGLAEVLTDKSFDVVLEELLFEPLGMTETSFHLGGDRRGRFQPLYINSGALEGFSRVFLDELNYDPSSRAFFGGEGLVSCMADYSKFCEMLACGGVFRGRRILSEESLAEMTTLSTEQIPGMTEGFGMGFSVFVVHDAGPERSGAPDGVFGWSGYHNTHFWIDPKSRLYGLFMSRAREFTFDISARLRRAVYGG